MQDALDVLTTPRRLGPDGEFEAAIPDGWQQGKGAFGGLVLATVTRACEAQLADAGRPLRSMTAELVGPVMPGAARIRVEVLRAGRSVTTLAARLEQAGEVQAHAVLSFGAPRGGPSNVYLSAPDRPHFSAVRALPMEGPFFPTFAKHYEFRNTGPLPFAGGKDPVTRGWVKPRNAGARCDAAWVVACADGWWPALFSAAEQPRPMATLGYTLEIVSSLDGLNPEEPVFHAAKMDALHDGYSAETRQIWAPDGRLIALNHQTFVVIR